MAEDYFNYSGIKVPQIAEVSCYVTNKLGRGTKCTSKGVDMEDARKGLEKVIEIAKKGEWEKLESSGPKYGSSLGNSAKK